MKYALFLFQVFPGNSDQNTVVKHFLNTDVMARYVRFYPVTYHNFPCLRVEIFVRKWWNFLSFMHKLNVDNTVQWELLMLKLSLSIFSVNLETTWSPPNMLVTVLFHLNKNAKVTVIRKQTPRHKAQLIWNIMLKLGKMNELLRRLNNIRLPKWNDFWIYLTLQNPLNTLM